jgi:predicted transcriptional regulator
MTTPAKGHIDTWGAPDNYEPRVSTTVRVPDELAAEVRRWAKLTGKSQGALLAEAWADWLRTHKAEVLADLDKLRAEVESA